LVDLKKI